MADPFLMSPPRIPNVSPPTGSAVSRARMARWNDVSCHPNKTWRTATTVFVCILLAAAIDAAVAARQRGMLAALPAMADTILVPQGRRQLQKERQEQQQQQQQQQQLERTGVDPPVTTTTTTTTGSSSTYCRGRYIASGVGPVAVLSGDGNVIATRSLGGGKGHPTTPSRVGVSVLTHGSALFQSDSFPEVARIGGGSGDVVSSSSDDDNDDDDDYMNDDDDDDFSGRSLALSMDGRVLAVASACWHSGRRRHRRGLMNGDGHKNDTTAFSTACGAFVRLYRYDYPTDSWRRRGDDLTRGILIGTSAAGSQDRRQQYGVTVSLSGDGDILAIGMKRSGDSAGRVRIYRWSVVDDGNTSGSNTSYNNNITAHHSISSGWWVQLGRDLVGRQASDQFGHSLSLSADGRTLAVLADVDTGRGTHVVQVYRYNEHDDDQGRKDDGDEKHRTTTNATKTMSARVWSAVGGDLELNGYEVDAGRTGAAVSRRGLGRLVSMSADGTTVAAGSLYSWGDNASAAHVFALDENAKWRPRGQPIGRGNAGFATSLSADGRTVAVGAVRFNEISAHVRVYRYNPAQEDWVEGVLKSSGGGEGDGNEASTATGVAEVSGFSVALSYAGKTPIDAGGEVTVYCFDDTSFAAPSSPPTTRYPTSSRPTTRPTTRPSSVPAYHPVVVEAPRSRDVTIFEILAVTLAATFAAFWFCHTQKQSGDHEIGHDLPVAVLVHPTQPPPLLPSLLRHQSLSVIVEAQVMTQSAVATPLSFPPSEVIAVHVFPAAGDGAATMAVSPDTISDVTAYLKDAGNPLNNSSFNVSFKDQMRHHPSQQKSTHTRRCHSR